MKLSSCGLDCEQCEAFIATQNNDNDLRSQTAEKWSAMYNLPMTPEDINCTGCRLPGAKIGHCGECRVRQCCIDKNHTDCGVCDRFSCEIIEDFFKMFPDNGEQNRRRLLRLE